MSSITPLRDRWPTHGGRRINRSAGLIESNRLAGEARLHDQRPVARILSNRLEARMNSQEHDSGALFQRGLEPLERLVDIAQTRVNGPNAPGGNHPRRP